MQACISLRYICVFWCITKPKERRMTGQNSMSVSTVKKWQMDSVFTVHRAISSFCVNVEEASNSLLMPMCWGTALTNGSVQQNGGDFVGQLLTHLCLKCLLQCQSESTTVSEEGRACDVAPHCWRISTGICLTGILDCMYYHDFKIRLPGRGKEA